MLIQTFNTYKIILFGVFGIVCVGIFVCGLILLRNISYSNISEDESESQEEYYATQKLLLESSGDSYRQIFDTHIQILFKNEGINGMLSRIKYALSSGQIEMYVCHSLAHDIGHYGGYPDNFVYAQTFITEESVSLCGSGFMHGVEAQLANNPDMNTAIEDLYTFCRLALPLHPYYNACYHGAGHSFMEMASIPQEALKNCDRLKTDMYAGPGACYRGVFSEHADMAMKLGKDATYLLSFCGSLDALYHEACAEELNGFNLSSTASDSEIEGAVMTCVNSEYSEVIQRGCLVSVAVSVTDRLLGQDKEVLPPPYLLSLQSDFIEAYIKSTVSSFKKTSTYVSGKTLEPFCKSFSGIESRTKCFSSIATDVPL